MEWERSLATESGGGREEEAAKRALIRWRLHGLLAELTGELHHFHDAVMARPDLSVSRAALGCALARQGRIPEAIPHLRTALKSDPFDTGCARALYQALGDASLFDGQRRLARDRHVLHLAAPQAVPLEPWVAEPAQSGEGLVSVVLLCGNTSDVTRRCLESVLRETRAPYELILIDEGSAAGVPDEPHSFGAAKGPTRVEVIRTEKNLGVTDGIGRGISVARGEYAVLLNNDAMVFPGWVESLIGWAHLDSPRDTGVGAIIGTSPFPRPIPVDHVNSAGDLALAATRRDDAPEKAGGPSDFYLLIRRDVSDRLAPSLDERDRAGSFDHIRVAAREANYLPLVAMDVLVRHCGSRTFRGLRIDSGRHLSGNYETSRPNRRQVIPQADDIPPPVGMPPTSVSLCMMVKNEEHNLAACLNSVRDLVSEVIVVDTGSTDRTRKIARAMGAKVFDFPWVDSFSAARNEGVKHATGDWVFWMDADDRLPEESRQPLRHLIASLKDENAAYVMK
jgi:glycosyltransferase involved in cell wall biosynthesis